MALWVLDDIQYRVSGEAVVNGLRDLLSECLEKSFDRDRHSMMTLTQVHLVYGELVHVEYEADEGPEIWPGGGDQ